MFASDTNKWNTNSIMNLLLKTAIVPILLIGVVVVFAVDTAAQSQLDGRQCDPVVSALASAAFPGWGQALNHDSQRKWIIHFAIGLGTTLAMIYRWNNDDGRIFRTARILWSFYSGIEAYANCYDILGIQTSPIS